jgi:hypothetical protein
MQQAPQLLSACPWSSAVSLGVVALQYTQKKKGLKHLQQKMKLDTIEERIGVILFQVELGISKLSACKLFIYLIPIVKC